MKRHFLYALVLLLAVPFAGATDFVASSNYVLKADHTATNELWLNARTITFAGTAADDCFLLADNLNQNPATNIPTLQLTGSFLGDVWGAGEFVTLSGTAANHARLAAMKMLILTGNVGRNLMAFAPTISLASNATVGGSALLVGQDIIADGTIRGDVRIMATKVILSGRFDGNVNITAGDITVTPGTRIAGNLVYRMDRDLVLDSRVTLGGKMMKTDLLQPEARPPTTIADLLLQLALLCGAILAGLVFVTIVPGIMALSVHKLADSPWRCVLFGILTAALVPVTALFLFFTLVGIPLCVMFMLAYLILIYFSKIVIGLYVGHLLLRRKMPIPASLLFPVMALGLLVLYVAVNLPFPVGLLAWFAITLAGMGALVSAILDRRIPVMVAYPPNSSGKPPPLPGVLPPGAV